MLLLLGLFPRADPALAADMELSAVILAVAVAVVVVALAQVVDSWAAVVVGMLTLLEALAVLAVLVGAVVVVKPVAQAVGL